MSGAKNTVHISGYAIEHDDDDDEMDMYNDEMVTTPFVMAAPS